MAFALWRSIGRERRETRWLACWSGRLARWLGRHKWLCWFGDVVGCDRHRVHLTGCFSALVICGGCSVQPARSSQRAGAGIHRPLSLVHSSV